MELYLTRMKHILQFVWNKFSHEFYVCVEYCAFIVFFQFLKGNDCDNVNLTRSLIIAHCSLLIAHTVLLLFHNDGFNNIKNIPFFVSFGHISNGGTGLFRVPFVFIPLNFEFTVVVFQPICTIFYFARFKLNQFDVKANEKIRTCSQ